MIYDVVHTMYPYIYCTPRWGETIYIYTYIYVCVSKSSQSTLIYYVVFFGPTVIFLPITTKHVFRKTQSAAVKIQHNIL